MLDAWIIEKLKEDAHKRQESQVIVNTIIDPEQFEVEVRKEEEHVITIGILCTHTNCLH